jgi:hypothetical protein
MAIRRLRQPPHAVPLMTPTQTLYEVRFSAAFLRPRSGLTTVRFTPELGRLGFDGARVTFRTIPLHLHRWLRRIDTWIEYANSVVEE